MACPDSWYKLQPLMKIVFVLTWVAFSSTVLGFATPVWISGHIPIKLFTGGSTSKTTMINHLGLWQGCGDEYGCITIVTKDMPAFFHATRAFACFSLISAFVTTGVIFWYSCVSKDSGRVLVFSLITSFVTAGLLMITLAIFGDTDGVKDYLSFSFAMMCIAGILYFLNALFMVFYMAIGRR